MLHSGIDLHQRDLTATTVDADGQLVKTARLRTTRAAVTQYFAALGAGASEQRAVVESTSTWSWRADHLRAAGVGLTLGHSKYIEAISYAKVKTDAVDAATLAPLLRSDLIPAAHGGASPRSARNAASPATCCGSGSSSWPSARGARTPWRACSRSTTSRRPTRCPRCHASSAGCTRSSACS